VGNNFAPGGQRLPLGGEVNKGPLILLGKNLGLDGEKKVSGKKLIGTKRNVKMSDKKPEINSGS
jgi:hypothetical protein